MFLEKSKMSCPYLDTNPGLSIPLVTITDHTTPAPDKENMLRFMFRICILKEKRLKINTLQKCNRTVIETLS